MTSLTRYRWSLPVLAHISRAEGAKYVTLVRRLGASDKAVRQSLDYLLAQRWIVRNLGHGHPSRPEYLIAPEATMLGLIADRTLATLERFQAQEAATDRWAMPVLAALTAGETRFSQLTITLAPISPRALALTLKKLADLCLAVRTVTQEFPPATIYEPTERGVEVAAIYSSRK